MPNQHWNESAHAGLVKLDPPRLDQLSGIHHVDRYASLGAELCDRLAHHLIDHRRPTIDLGRHVLSGRPAIDEGRIQFGRHTVS